MQNYDYLRHYAHNQAVDLSAAGARRQNIIKVEHEKLTKIKDHTVLMFRFKAHNCKELQYTVLAYTSDIKELKMLVHLIGVNMDKM